jgi:hypothetical protein
MLLAGTQKHGLNTAFFRGAGRGNLSRRPAKAGLLVLDSGKCSSAFSGTRLLVFTRTSLLSGSIPLHNSNNIEKPQTFVQGFSILLSE